jgi:hypothetical protein
MVKKILIILIMFLGVSNIVSGDLSESHIEAMEMAYNHYQKQLMVDNEIKRRLKIVRVHAFVESSFNNKGYNKSENAIGYLQIRKIMVKEINLHTSFKFSHQQAFSKEISEKAFMAFQNEFNPAWDLELAARRWNGGRQGELKKSTLEYYQKIKKNYNKVSIFTKNHLKIRNHENKTSI